MRRLPVLLAVTLLIAGCGYFNSLYNANRRFAEAERAAARGEASASAAYVESIEKAAVSYRRYPDGRWADDALLLIGRARFALHEDLQAVAALRHALALTDSEDIATAAHAWAGAALARLERTDSAQLHLDAAVAAAPLPSEVGSFARFWRARVGFATGREDAAWADLDALQQGHSSMAQQVGLETAVQAAARRDSARLRSALALLATRQHAGPTVYAITALLDSVARQWSPAIVWRASEPLENAAWPAGALHHVNMARAHIVLQAGDTATAIAAAMRVAAAVRGGVGSEARLAVARLRLARLEDPAELDEIRALLLAAYDEPIALELQRGIGAAELLIARGAAPGSALSRFVAAEFARDELRAPLLARRLFLEYVQLVPDAVWSGKAALAAADIGAGPDTHAALAARRDNIYVAALHGEADGEAFMLAEQRLARGIAGLRMEALADAANRDVVTGRAVAVLDSTRAAARTDSVRIACGTFIDSIGVRGIRADSTRSACMRGDGDRITFVLNADTVLLLDSTRIRAATPGSRTRSVVRPDTLLFRP